MAETEARAGISATKGVAHKFIDLFLDYLVPLATFFLGVFTGVSTWGGVNSLWSVLNAGSTDLGNAAGWPVSAALFGGIFGITGAAFWKLGREHGMIYRGVGRAFGGYFIGTALSYLLAWFTNKPVADGLIDELVGAIRGVA